MKCSHCGSHLAPAFAVGDYVVVDVPGHIWNTYEGFIMEVDETELESDEGHPYLLSVVDENKNHIGLESFWDAKSLRLLSAAGTFHKSYGELFDV